jgi:hypothetical protein
MSIGDLVRFKTGYLGTILRMGSGQDYATIWVHGIVKFQNPTHMTIAKLQLNSEVVSESR